MELLKKNVSRGNHFYQKVSRDLVELLQEVKSFSPRNLLYMSQFYRMYHDVEITLQIDAQSEKYLITPQVDAQLNFVFMIPWGHHKVILDKCKEKEKALFFVNKTIESNWSRAVLLKFLDTNPYERQGKAVSNFTKVLPDLQSDLTQGLHLQERNTDLRLGLQNQFIDMLFYNIFNHCYVVEIKIRDFQPGDMGQLGTYVAAVDRILKKNRIIKQ